MPSLWIACRQQGGRARGTEVGTSDKEWGRCGPSSQKHVRTRSPYIRLQCTPDGVHPHLAAIRQRVLSLLLTLNTYIRPLTCLAALLGPFSDAFRPGNGSCPSPPSNPRAYKTGLKYLLKLFRYYSSCFSSNKRRLTDLLLNCYYIRQLTIYKPM